MVTYHHDSPAVSVVICAHAERRLDLTVRAAESALTQTFPPLETFVVVDSNPQLYRELTERLPSVVRVIESNGYGVSEARNSGVAPAQGQVVAFLDDDAWADKQWIAELSAAFTDERVIGAGGRIEPEFQVSNGWLPPELYWIVGATYSGHPTGSVPISRPIGANMAFRRDALCEVGGFSAAFGPAGPEAKSHSNEEVSVALALERSFGPERIIYVPSAVVHHSVPPERLTLAYLRYRSRVEGLSKADVRLLYGGSSMAYDRSYVTATLLPSIARYLAAAVRHRDATAARFGAACVLSLSLTAWAYAGRLVSARRPRCRPASLRLGGRLRALRQRGRPAAPSSVRLTRVLPQPSTRSDTSHAN